MNMSKLVPVIVVASLETDLREEYVKVLASEGHRVITAATIVDFDEHMRANGNQFDIVHVYYDADMTDILSLYQNITFTHIHRELGVLTPAQLAKLN